MTRSTNMAFLFEKFLHDRMVGSRVPRDRYGTMRSVPRRNLTGGGHVGEGETRDLRQETWGDIETGRH